MDGHSLELWVVSWVVSYQIPCYQRCIASGLLREINASCNDKENSKFQWLSYMYYIITILLLYIVLCYIILYHVISGHIISHYSWLCKVQYGLKRVEIEELCFIHGPRYLTLLWLFSAFSSQNLYHSPVKGPVKGSKRTWRIMSEGFMD